MKAGSVSEDMFVALQCYSVSGCDLATDWVVEVRSGGNCDGMFSYSLNDEVYVARACIYRLKRGMRLLRWINGH